jgi:hypothetical protein
MDRRQDDNGVDRLGISLAQDLPAQFDRPPGQRFALLKLVQV